MQRLLIAGFLCLSAGCLDWSALADRQNAKETEAVAEAAEDAAQPAGGGGQVAVGGAARNQDLPDVEARIVDKQQALQERPHLVETTNRITASDPLFAPLQGIFAVGSKAEILGFTHTIQLHKAANDAFPTYEEFMDYYRQANVKLKGIKPYQVYAYDESDGTIVILEDAIEKERLSREWREKNGF
jgi:hypothetical protein